MLNIVIPMAGQGSRFSQAGYKAPKPLILVTGKTMIELVIENLRPSVPHRFIFICRRQHMKNYPLCELLEALSPGCVIIGINEVTQGAACTALFVKDIINNAAPLMIANCDQYVDVDIDKYLSAFDASSADG